VSGSVSIAQRLAPEAETVLYRVVQEALANVARHAQAERVFVELSDSEADRGVVLTIADDGVGFDMADLSSFVSGGHFGLAGMRERVELTSGRYTVTSSPGNGTRIQVWLSAAECEVAA
jgi:signal transduction histidine kinase